MKEVCAVDHLTDAPTMAPTASLPESDTDSPTTKANVDDESEEDLTSEADPWYVSMFKSREHEGATTESNNTMDDEELRRKLTAQIDSNTEGYIHNLSLEV